MLSNHEHRTLPSCRTLEARQFLNLDPQLMTDCLHWPNKSNDNCKTQSQLEDKPMDPFNHHNEISACLPVPTATHCVFRRGSFWLALPAIVVREVMPRPNMVFVPGTPNIFVGLCHVRSEFIPVLNLDAVLPEFDLSDDSVMLVVDDTDGPWAVLVDEITSLRALEISDAPATDVFDTSCVVIGWATYDSHVIQVLDQSRVRMRAEQELAAIWQSADVLRQAFTNTETRTGQVHEMCEGW